MISNNFLERKSLYPRRAFDSALSKSVSFNIWDSLCAKQKCWIIDLNLHSISKCEMKFLLRFSRALFFFLLPLLLGDEGERSETAEKCMLNDSASPVTLSDWVWNIFFNLSFLPIHQVSRTTKLHTFIDSIEVPFHSRFEPEILSFAFYWFLLHKFEFYVKSVSGAWLLFGVVE